MNALDELRIALPPPNRPFFAAGDWLAVETSLGTALPSDYKAFINTYGEGGINDCLVIQSPFRWIADGRDVRQTWTNWASIYHDFAGYGANIPYPIFPAPGGVLPFGSDGDVNWLSWRTVGEPDAWPFVYYDRSKGCIEVPGLSATGFVLELVTQRSPLSALVGNASVYESPCHFAALARDPREVRTVHPIAIEMESLVKELVARWPADQLRFRRSATTITVLVDPLIGSISVSRDGDQRTWLRVGYDQSSAEQVEKLVRELLRRGFSIVD